MHFRLSELLSPLRESCGSAEPSLTNTLHLQLSQRTSQIPQHLQFAMKERKDILHRSEAVLAVEFLRSSKGLREIYVCKLG